MSKEKILAKLSDQRKSLKKLNLSMVSDLQTAIETMKSYDVEYESDNAISEYETALVLMEEAKLAANKYIVASQEFDETIDSHWEAYQEASRLFGEIEQQLYSLGIEESPEIEQFRDDVVEGERQGQSAFAKTQSDFSYHNELLDISEFN